MIKREVIAEKVAGYDLEDVRVGSVASHSALDVADGAVEEGFKTVLFCQKGRISRIKRDRKPIRD